MFVRLRLFQDVFGKKTYTANDFLKDEFISCLHQRPPKDEDTPSDSDWVELSDDGRDFLSNRKQPRETAEDGACPQGRTTLRKDASVCLSVLHLPHC